MHRDLWTPQGSPRISPRATSPPTPAWPQQGWPLAPHSPALVSWAHAWACVPSCSQRGAQCPGWGSPWLRGGRNSPRDYSWWFYNSSVFPTGYVRPHPNNESAERPYRSSWAPSWAPTEKILQLIHQDPVVWQLLLCVKRHRLLTNWWMLKAGRVLLQPEHPLIYRKYEPQQQLWKSNLWGQ